MMSPVLTGTVIVAALYALALQGVERMMSTTWTAIVVIIFVAAVVQIDPTRNRLPGQLLAGC